MTYHNGHTYMTDKAIVKEIEEKLNYLHTDYNLVCMLLHKSYQKHLEEDSSYHSYNIEEKILTKRITRENKKGLKELKNAFRWGEDNFLPDALNQAFIKDLAGKVEPKMPSIYRGTSAIILGAKHRPPGYEKIYDEMDNYIFNLKNILNGIGTISALESATYAHLHLVRIHPFIDGNGRTARTFQNIILKKSNLPPPIIYAGERDDYFRHLDRAILAWKSKRNETQLPENRGFTEDGEADFYNFIAGKISASLDRLIYSCKTSRFFKFNS